MWLGTIQLYLFRKIDGGLLRSVAVPAGSNGVSPVTFKAGPLSYDVRLFTGFVELWINLNLFVTSVRLYQGLKESKSFSSKMISFGFRIKLLFAMLTVVGATTAVSLIVALQRVEAANDRLFRARVNEQLSYLPREQAARLREAHQQAGRFVNQTEVQQAVEELDVGRLYARTRESLASMLADPLLKGRGPVNLDQPPVIHIPRNRARVVASHFVFLDEQGEFLLPEEGAGSFVQTRTQREFRAKLDALHGGLVDLSEPASGYVAISGLNDTRRLLEVVCLPVEQAGGGRKVGTFIMGFPVSRRGEQTLDEVSELATGVWVDGALLSGAIAERDQPRVADWLRVHAEDVAQDDNAEAPFIQMHGVPYRVFVAPMDSDPALPKAYKVGLHAWADALAVREEIKAQILGTGAIMGILAVGVSWLISLGLFKPVRRLYKATMRLREGDYDVRIPVRSNDEFGKLATAFNETAEELSLKDKYRDVLNKVTDKYVADRMISGDVALGGETHGMTVLFCDMRKYTEITQHMSPEESVLMLNEHMTAMTRVVHEHDGLVDKFVGDMIMAVFGATASDPIAPERAVACARAMIAERKGLNMMSGREINVGVGVATGEMLAGFMGSEDRLNFTVIGQGANLASRLCTVAGPMDILVDEATCEAAREGRSAEPLPPMGIKGFSDLQAVYRLRPEAVPENEPLDRPRTPA